MKNTNKITNRNGYEFSIETKSAWQAIIMMMDDEICDNLSNKLAPCTEQKFLKEYEKAHMKKYGEEWELSKANPVW